MDILLSYPPFLLLTASRRTIPNKQSKKQALKSMVYTHTAHVQHLAQPGSESRIKSCILHEQQGRSARLNQSVSCKASTTRPKLRLGFYRQGTLRTPSQPLHLAYGTQCLHPLSGDPA